MEPTTTDTLSSWTSRGRWLCVLGIALLLLGIAGYALQFGMKHMTPWYAPILGTVGVVMMVAGFLTSPGVLRGVGVVLVGAVCAFEWWFLVGFARVPEYAGSATAGQPVPAFTSVYADGRTFSDADLRSGKPTVLIFFRGRW